jgi:hypothetical protein
MGPFNLLRSALLLALTNLLLKADERTLSFQRGVLPALTKFGCNKGGYHGKQARQNGFHLS